MRHVIFILLILNFFTFNAKAEIAFIDISFILNNSEVGKSLNIYVDNIKNQNIQKFKEKENRLIKKEQSLLAQKNILNESEFEKKFDAFSDEVKKYRSDKKLSIERLNKIKIDNTNKILKILNPIITNYVDVNSISLVIPKKNIIVGKKNLDITDQIIKLLNNDIKKLNF